MKYLDLTDFAKEDLLHIDLEASVDKINPDTFAGGIRLCAQMLWPYSDEKQAQYLAHMEVAKKQAMRLAHENESLRDEPASGVPDADPINFLVQLRDSPSKSELVAEVMQRWENGCYAGTVANTIFQINERHASTPEVRGGASLAKALDVVASMSGAPSKNPLREHWNEYRPVVHLYAAIENAGVIIHRWNGQVVWLLAGVKLRYW